MRTADAPSRQKWSNACATRAPGEERLSTKPRVTPLRRAFAQQSRQSVPEGSRVKLEVKVDATEMRQEHRDLHDMGTFDGVPTTTKKPRNVLDYYHLEFCDDAFLQGHELWSVSKHFELLFGRALQKRNTLAPLFPDQPQRERVLA